MRRTELPRSRPVRCPGQCGPLWGRATAREGAGGSDWPAAGRSTRTPRHTAAINLLLAGVDITVIALWLGHESPTIIRVYLHTDMALKEPAIARTAPLGTHAERYHAPDNLLAFLDQL